MDAAFAAFGTVAVYTPAGGDPVPVPLIARRPDAIVGCGETFVVQGEPERRNPDRMVWNLDARLT